MFNIYSLKRGEVYIISNNICLPSYVLSFEITFLKNVKIKIVEHEIIWVDNYDRRHVPKNFSKEKIIDVDLFIEKVMKNLSDYEKILLNNLIQSEKNICIRKYQKQIERENENFLSKKQKIN
jgi:hypothetical protein